MTWFWNVATMLLPFVLVLLVSELLLWLKVIKGKELALVASAIVLVVLYKLDGRPLEDFAMRALGVGIATAFWILVERRATRKSKRRAAVDR